jgi:hypothetical protein
MPINAMIAQGSPDRGASALAITRQNRQLGIENRNRNSLLEMQGQRLNMDQERHGMYQQAFDQGQQDRAATMQSEQVKGQLDNAYKLYMSGNRDAFRTIAELEGLDEEDLNGLDVDKFVQVNAQMRGIGQAAGEQFTLSPGAARYDASGQQIAAQPFAPRQAPAAPAGYQWANGGLAPIPGGPADKPQSIAVSPAQKAVDSKFAGDYVQFINGGAADAAKSIEELREAANTLESGKKNITGPVLGALPNWVRSTVNPVSMDTQEAVEQTVQRSLRAILGAQFTEKEGERLIARAYNPRLDEKTNAKRVKRLLTQLERALEGKQAAASYYEQNGTLAGFQGRYNFSTSDFNPDIAEEAKPGAAKAPVQSFTTPGGAKVEIID